MYRNPLDFITPETEKNTIEFYLTSTESKTKKKVLEELQTFSEEFIKDYIN